ncbi:hypothetical protein ABZ502_17400 [Streptomyces abikoensis]|uniref:hypothetical protein n=1 Tax=Streptomyces abikoensis TaxID=97398 RepID=UPI0033F10B88
MDTTTTTSYGTWYTVTGTVSPAENIAVWIGGSDSEWLTRVEESGALDEMEAAYYRAIQAELPEGVYITPGADFIGPALGIGDDVDLDLSAIVESIDVGQIVERFDPDRTDAATDPSGR